MTEIKDYLHLYGIDCEIMTPDGLGSVLVIYPNVVEVHLNTIAYQQVMKGRRGGGEMHYKYFYTEDIKLILRPLSDMDGKESLDWADLKGRFWEGSLTVEKMGNLTHWLLSKHFDLFCLIGAGLAIDATTLKTQTP